MSILKASVLGVVQGLAEFLPISSSGHLNLLEILFNIKLDQQLLFNILLHVGTLIAVLAVFWRDWLHMILHPIKDKTLLLLIIASLPALLAKLLLGDSLTELVTSSTLLGVSFLFTGLLLSLTQWVSQRNQDAEQGNRQGWSAARAGDGRIAGNRHPAGRQPQRFDHLWRRGFGAGS